NDPEPCGKRTLDFCTCSSHLASGSKPYLSLRIFRGGLLNSHMPSSACDVGAASSAAVRISQGIRFCIGALLETGRPKINAKAFLAIEPAPLCPQAAGCG